MSDKAPADLSAPDLSAAAAEAAKAEAARRPIETLENPQPRIDYLVRLEGEAAGGAALVTLMFVPDKRIVQADGFSAYLGRLSDFGAETQSLPERLALRILADLNDELVPRWVQIIVTISAGHQVLVEDRQPKWDNKSLLVRAGGF
ncbi:MAG: hypothetical protein RIB45_01470 [Marivibrio sp.]|uniref:hypothetical protein n=1 Tax=Marivibrio sp. TaxID=2039719 RepID=UPI0032EEC5F0